MSAYGRVNVRGGGKARQFTSATEPLFDPQWGTVFEPFADDVRRGGTQFPAVAPGAREPLAEFINRHSSGHLALGAMVSYLIEITAPRTGIHRDLRDWLMTSKKKRPIEIYGFPEEGRAKAM